MEFKNLLKLYSEEIDFEISEKMLSDFEKYRDLLVEWNEKMNLTAITDAEGIAIKHFIDSIVPIKHFNDDSHIIDVGIGAGFPTIPLKIVNTSLKITALDSLNKRLSFLKEVKETLQLQNINFIHGRAEDIGQNKSYREKYQYATARAVASLNVLTELCLPLIEIGGQFIVYKGEKWKDELKEAEFAIKKLGGEVIDVKEYSLPKLQDKRSIIIISKISKSPAIYPRKAGTPAKKPLTN